MATERLHDQHELSRTGQHVEFVHSDHYVGEEGERAGRAALTAVALTRVRFLWTGHSCVPPLQQVPPGI